MKRMALLISALALIAAACGSGEGTAVGASDEPTTTAAPTTTAPPTTTTTEAMMGGIHATETDLGTVLVDADGFTLYLFLPDVAGTSNCVDDCAAAWPPLAADDIGTPGDGIDAALLGEITRPDGALQATYNDKPLYGYAGDFAAGDTSGQGVNDVWFVIGVDGKGIGIPRAGSDYGTVDY